MSGAPPLAVGLDVGGSRTRALVVDAAGKERARRNGPPGAVDPGRPERTARVLEALLREMEAAGEVELPAASLCAGVAGAGRDAVRDELRARLEEAGLARRTRVLTDGEVALFDAHGDGPGLVLVAGTGSVAWGRDAAGRLARAGGWGPILGDEGSGHAVARAALRRVTRAADGREEETELGPRLLARLGLERVDELVPWAAAASRADIASLAPHVVQMADAGVEPADEIVAGAVDELTAAVGAVLRRLGPWEEPPPLALAGGLLDPGRPLRERVGRAAGSRLAVRPVEDRVDPVRGAAALAGRVVG